MRTAIIAILVGATLVACSGVDDPPLGGPFGGTTDQTGPNGGNGDNNNDNNNDTTGEGVPPIPVTIWIRQGIFSTSIKLRTGESTSYSTRCLLEADQDAGRFRFWYSYDNSPRAEYRHRSARHEGVAWLEVDADTDPERLIGCYYTDRKTSGDIDVRRNARTIEGEPAAAAAA